MEQTTHDVHPQGGRPTGVAEISVDLALGMVATSREVLVTLGSTLRPVGRPLVHLVLSPPMLPRRLQPRTWLDRAVGRGVAYRHEVLVDLDELLDRLLPALSTQLLRHVDLTEMVKQNVDVVTLAEDLIAEIDLPTIIRESTGAVASDTVVGVRMQGISADEAVGRAMDRLRSRFARRTPPPASAPAGAT
jgi:hypothetical protein